jgi:flagellar FliL protein
MSNENPGSRRSKLVPLLLLLNAVLLVAVLVVLVLRPGGGGPTPEAAPEPGPAAAPSAPGPTFRLPDLTVHLRNPEADRYARIGVELELYGEEGRATVNAHLPMIRDSFLAWFSDRTVEELQGSEGLARAKADLLARFDRILPARTVRALYITDFVVQ